MPDPAGLGGISPELGLGQLVPAADASAAAPVSGGTAAPASDRAAAPIGEDVSASGGPFGARAAAAAGMLVGLSALAGGCGWLWWRNRDSHYWPA